MRAGKCGRSEGHAGQHLSAEALERKRERGREYKRERRKDPEFRARKREYDRERWANDPEFRARRRTQAFIWGTLNGGYARYDLLNRPAR